MWLTAIEEKTETVASCQLSISAAALLTRAYLHSRAERGPPGVLMPMALCLDRETSAH